MKQKCFPVKMLMPSKKTGGFPLTLKQISGLMIYRKQENFSVEIRFSFKFFLGDKRPARQEMLCFSPHFVYSAPQAYRCNK